MVKTTLNRTQFIRQWIKLLLSGKYEQGTENLRSPDNSFCCLGVACDLYDPDNWKELGSHWFYSPSPHLEEDVTLPGNVQDFLGFSKSEAPVSVESVNAVLKREPVRESLAHALSQSDIAFNHVCLTALNDNGATFSDIAKVLKEEFKDELAELEEE